MLEIVFVHSLCEFYSDSTGIFKVFETLNEKKRVKIIGIIRLSLSSSLLSTNYFITRLEDT